MKPIIEHIATEKLIPYARNSRTHSEEQVAQVAASMREFGFTNPVLIDAGGVIVAGHGRVMAAKSIGLQEVPCIRLGHLTESQIRAYVIADNKLAENAGWDEDMLRLEMQELQADDFDLGLLGFGDAEIAELLKEDIEPSEGLTDADEIPEVRREVISKDGDIWVLGKHRVMCGDSTIMTDVEKLMAGQKAQLLHADPPYGMGKEGEGVANDNLYSENLDAFQMKWWATFRAFMVENASAYIWGNAPDLWRLWYVGGLGDSERLELRNEIVWDKNSMAGMASPHLTQFPIASERCLFFQIGNQFRGNINAEDFPSSWEPIRGYMESEARAAGVNEAEVKRVCGVGMYPRWFTRSQFTLIPEKYYRMLGNEYIGHFLRPWRELKKEWDRVTVISYFNNAHEPMRDVWEFSRVTGVDRHGHATPKPVAMMKRVMMSSLPHGGLVAEPFGGSGATLIGAEETGRVCFCMEMQPRYVDVIIRRWQEFTGKAAVRESDGATFDSLCHEEIAA